MLRANKLLPPGWKHFYWTSVLSLSISLTLPPLTKSGQVTDAGETFRCISGALLDSFLGNLQGSLGRLLQVAPNSLEDFARQLISISMAGLWLTFETGFLLLPKRKKRRRNTVTGSGGGGAFHHDRTRTLELPPRVESSISLYQCLPPVQEDFVLYGISPRKITDLTLWSSSLCLCLIILVSFSIVLMFHVHCFGDPDHVERWQKGFKYK